MAFFQEIPTGFADPARARAHDFGAHHIHRRAKMNVNPTSQVRPVVLSMAAALALAACGGGSSDTPAAAFGFDTSGAEKHILITPGESNVISKWNEIAVQTAAVASSPGGATPEERVAGPDVTTMQLAVYDAVIAIAGTHKPYAIKPTTAVAGAGEDAMKAAAVEAAYRVLKGLFPSRGSVYEAAYTSDMSAIADGDAKALGRQAGLEVASGMLALRANDGRETALPPYVPGTLPGQFRGTNPVNRIAPYIKPFTTHSHSQFRVAEPYSIQSEAYAGDFIEVKAIAGPTSTSRTALQTEIARFHTEPPGSFWARNLRQFATASSNIADNARVLAMLWTAQSDAGGACFESKYFYNFWRPTSAIQLAGTDDNALTLADPAWLPFVATPNHPEYPAAHGCASASAMEALRSFYGSKNLEFDFTSTVTGSTHHFRQTEDVLEEVRNARVWGGMHFRTSTEVGVEQAKNVTAWMTQRYFRPAD
ncbi:vanadium-dependent haloperoxidase [Variovorax sp. J22R24]|uniref:vanadium-dependent haloperoxidase n=1 Tax=Variovorax gracilis TaxID=3053502 RepID=UPI0025749D4F|nr:vanadium-dependent haloperoxidase [Variovorax sp. J22R24]MDM0109370.1 vanadium-dependent haloperoxidase [Variovorax sp. J22R24]